MNSDKRETFLPMQEAVALFMESAGQSLDKFDARQACLYTGLQLEELGEKIEVIMEGCLTEGQRQHLAPLHSMLRHFAKEFRDGLHQGDILRADHDKLIDADFDLAWVSIGALNSTSIDAYRAIAHGTFTNMDKFRNGVNKDANGKVIKPADWKAPDFSAYTDKAVRG